MRWRMAWLCVLSLMGLGCPPAFGPGGTIARGLKKDQQQILDISRKKPVCPSEAELVMLCEYPEDDICPRECLE